MNSPEFSARRGAASRAILRFALRDLRGGLRFYGIFIACLVLGVTALVATTKVAAWWILPVAVALLLALTLWRASRTS